MNIEDIVPGPEVMGEHGRKRVAQNMLEVGPIFLMDARVKAWKVIENANLRLFQEVWKIDGMNLMSLDDLFTSVIQAMSPFDRIYESTDEWHELERLRSKILEFKIGSVLIRELLTKPEELKALSKEELLHYIAYLEARDDQSSKSEQESSYEAADFEVSLIYAHQALLEKGI